MSSRRDDTSDHNGFVIDFPEYNADVLLHSYKQAVPGGNATKKAKSAEDHYNAVMDKFNLFERNINRRIDRLQGTVAFVAKCVEDFNDNFSSLMDVVKEKRATDVADNLSYEVAFPFRSTADVNSYLEHDPKMVKLVDRYVSHNLSLRTRLKPVAFCNYIHLTL